MYQVIFNSHMHNWSDHLDVEADAFRMDIDGVVRFLKGTETVAVVPLREIRAVRQVERGSGVGGANLVLLGADDEDGSA